MCKRNYSLNLVFSRCNLQEGKNYISSVTQTRLQNKPTSFIAVFERNAHRDKINIKIAIRDLSYSKDLYSQC
jgi:hypothetical protein